VYYKKRINQNTLKKAALVLLLLIGLAVFLPWLLAGVSLKRPIELRLPAVEEIKKLPEDIAANALSAIAEKLNNTKTKIDLFFLGPDMTGSSYSSDDFSLVERGNTTQADFSLAFLDHLPGDVKDVSYSNNQTVLTVKKPELLFGLYPVEVERKIVIDRNGTVVEDERPWLGVVTTHSKEEKKNGSFVCTQWVREN